MSGPTDLISKTKQRLKTRPAPKRVPIVPAEWGPIDPKRRPDGVTVRNVVIDNATGEVVAGEPLPEASDASAEGVRVEAALAPPPLPESYLREKEAERRTGYQRGRAPGRGEG